MILGIIILLFYMENSRKKWQLIIGGVCITVIASGITNRKCQNVVNFTQVSRNQSISIQAVRKKFFLTAILRKEKQ